LSNSSEGGPVGIFKKGSQISEKYWGEVEKGKKADAYLEVRKRRGHIFFEWNKCLKFRIDRNKSENTEV
jgi:hypothetical protein